MEKLQAQIIAWIIKQPGGPVILLVAGLMMILQYLLVALMCTLGDVSLLPTATTEESWAARIALACCLWLTNAAWAKFFDWLLGRELRRTMQEHVDVCSHKDQELLSKDQEHTATLVRKEAQYTAALQSIEAAGVGYRDGRWVLLADAREVVFRMQSILHRKEIPDDTA